MLLPPVCAAHRARGTFTNAGEHRARCGLAVYPGVGFVSDNQPSAVDRDRAGLSRQQLPSITSGGSPTAWSDTVASGFGLRQRVPRRIPRYRKTQQGFIWSAGPMVSTKTAGIALTNQFPWSARPMACDKAALDRPISISDQATARRTCRMSVATRVTRRSALSTNPPSNEARAVWRITETGGPPDPFSVS